jgi:hypothetical protein
MVGADGVAAGDPRIGVRGRLGLFVVRHPGEDLPGLGKRRLAVRIVRALHHIVDADDGLTGQCVQTQPSLVLPQGWSGSDDHIQDRIVRRHGSLIWNHAIQSDSIASGKRVARALPSRVPL